MFSPKYRGKILVGDVAMIAEGIICKTCAEMDIEIIEIAVNPDHVHIFFKYPPKYSLSYIEKRIKGSTSRVLRKEFPHLREWCCEHFWAPSCFHGSVGNGWDVVKKYISEQDTYEYNREKIMENSATGPVLFCPGYTVTDGDMCSCSQKAIGKPE